ncbi:YigZ family protein [Thermoanaerobacterium sp. PSU-2]|uniref:YigZ family protein n=1 Tax=Thermoanaerobacterium sp. PSU-2 TaxID=1930849 RepID=UPI000A14F1F3|nr:YigZ family protein [Thermoanaerobacterium sp. PSU-2]ORX23929.1 YigZ family protein [Thermoanaerobacterium sp. PSU-2]HHV73508.1 YigZ family protein [Thermoanaerobacterium sp.]
MLYTYKTIYKYGCKEVEIKRSRFIGHAKPVQNEDEAIEFVNSIKSAHRDATHNVYAYILGERDEVQRYSDDGEPSGTAGVPVLNVIKSEGLKNVAVVVTRYFGGILLGAGGLIRAYVKSAKLGLEAATIVEKILFKSLYITVDYTIFGTVQNELLKNNYIIKNIEYTDKVTLTVYVKYDERDDFIKHIINLTNAKSIIKEGNDLYLYKTGDKYLE